MISACSVTFSASGPLRGAGLVGDDAERRLERVGEVADLGAGALDDLLV